MKTNLFYSIVLSLFFAAGYSQTATFEGLGYINESAFPFSEASDVSYDGSVITGMTTSLHEDNNVVEAYRWTEEEGMIGIGGLLSGWTFFSYARAVSDDGTTIVGYSNSENTTFLEWEAMKWTADTGMVGLGDFVEEMFYSEATDVSYDGSVIVGRSYTNNRPMLWINGELQYLEENAFGEAWGVSGDGSIVVGSIEIDDVQQAFRWTQETGFQGLGAPAGGYSVAYKISADGNTVVGFQFGSNFEAFRWTEGNGMEPLGFLSGGNYSEANDVSDDGTTVVGFSNSEDGYIAFIWREGTGMQNLKELLETEYGLDLTGWTLGKATAISGDGTTIVGSGINPEGNQEAWRLVLPSSSGEECIAPDIFSTGTITGTTVEFSWNPASGETNGYNWFVMNIGESPDGGIPVTSGTTEPGITSAMATGLTPNTMYFVYLQTNCSEGGQSSYGGPFMIMTTEEMGINEFTKQMVFYPNPTTGIINLQTKEKISSVSVYNLAGQKVTFNSLNKENTSIDISNLPNGIYLVEVILHNNKAVKRYKVIKK